MNILILYASKNGVTKQCSEMLAELLKKSHTVTLVSAKDDPLPSPSDFDVAIIGSSVRMGTINSKIKKYMKQYAEILTDMHTAVFLCCGFPDEFDDYVATQVPTRLIASLGFHYFGGELKPEKLHGLDKFIVKRVRNSIRERNFENSALDQISLPEILPETIVRLSDSIRMLIDK